MTQTENTTLQLVTVGKEARIDTRELAVALNNQHENVLGLLTDYQSDFEKLGLFRFETGKVSGGRPPRFALLNEDQSAYLLTLVRNSATVTPLKLRLIQLFRAARDAAQTPALPASPLALSRMMLEALEQQDSRVTAIEQRLDASPITSEKVGAIYRLGQELGAVMGDYRAAWRVFKNRFNLASYRDLPNDQFEAGRQFLQMQIAAYTGQPRHDLPG